MRCGKPEHQLGQKCPAKNAKCKECHKIGHFYKVCQSKKRGKRANLVQIPPQDDDDTHIDENGVRQPNPPRVNMLKMVNHIGANRGPQGKHLKFPIATHPKGYKHHLVVRVHTAADVSCMNENTFQELFPEVELSVCRILETQLQTFQYWASSVPTCSLGEKSTEHQHQQLLQSTQLWCNVQNGCTTSQLSRGKCCEGRKCTQLQDEYI